MKRIYKVLPYSTRLRLFKDRYQALITATREHECETETKMDCTLCLTNVYLIGKGAQDLGIDPQAFAEEAYK